MIETSAMKEFILIANIAQIISLPTGFTVTPLTIQQGYLLKRKREVYSEPCQKSKMKVFKQIVKKLYLTYLTNCLSVFDHYVGLALTGLKLVKFKITNFL